MKIDPIWNNQLLEIETSEGTMYQTLVLKVTDQELRLQHPSNQDELLVPTGVQQVSVYFFDDKNNRYVYQTKLAFTDNRFVLPKPKPNQVEKVQRRHYFRVPATLDLWFEMGTEEDEKQKVKFVTDDISGGGVAFHCFNMEPFTMGDTLEGEIEIETPKKKIIVPFTGQIVNTSWMDSKRIRYALEFKSIKEMYRQEIMSYCIKRQTDIYKKIGDRF